MRILLTGVSGQLGWELRRSLAPLGTVIAADRGTLDLSDPDSIRQAIRAAGPELIVNPAAYTAVDQAEQEPELANAINGVAPGVMAEEAKRLGAGLIHFSTDYVFDGRKPGAYTEADAPNPLGAYGRSKLLGEQAVAAGGAPHLTLRTSWVYGARGRNFLLTMLRLARERDQLRVVADQYGAPTWCRMLAEATAALVGRMQAGALRLEDVSGTYHLSAAGSTSWHGFATHILQSAERRGLCRAPRLDPIPSSEYPLPAPRPANSVLDNGKFLRAFSLALPDWAESLELCLDEIR